MGACPQSLSPCSNSPPQGGRGQGARVKLFVFGLGYSALHLARGYRDRFACIAGTVTSRGKADRLAAEGIDAHVFGADEADAEIGDALRAADALLVCVPPD